MSAIKKISKPSSLLVGALGVVFGDIGTSPLYAFREALTTHHFYANNPERVFSILSLILWTIIIIVSIKYVIVIMKADNEGEGGTLALLALVNDLTRNTPLAYWATMLGLLGAAFFFGDCMLTPAISVLSAVEGLKLIKSDFDAYIIPLTLAIISGLFWIQHRGAGLVGQFFGPIMMVWFTTIGLLGISNIAATPTILYAINPYHALSFLWHAPWESAFVLGSVFLAVTGGEALYADMGHFGKHPIRMAWFSFVLPALLLNYFGQGALLLANPAALENPFYMLAPENLHFPLVILATMATVIASQAVISGAFSIFRQAVQLDYFPRITTLHTSNREEGQIYIPSVNWTLYIAVVLLVLFFQTSSHLASAYGIAVASTMFIETILVTIVMLLKWHWPMWLIAIVSGPLFLIDLIFLLANGIKIPHGGWFSLLVGIFGFVLLSTWRIGRMVVRQEISRTAGPLENFISELKDDIIRVPGTVVVLTGNRLAVPLALVNNLKHNHVLHENVILLTILTKDVPEIPKNERLELLSFEKGFYRLIAHYGFKQNPSIPRILKQCADLGLHIKISKTSFLLSRSTIIPVRKGQMSMRRDHLFALMNRNATNATDYFHIPSNRVIEIGVRIEI